LIRVDLHTHSVFSDGTLTPEELVKKAKRRGVSVLSLTDHDTTAGLKVFVKSCSGFGVRGVTGVELSAESPWTLHILGYQISPNEALESDLRKIREHRDCRNVEICKKLQHLGYGIQMEEVQKEAGGDVVARPHIARVLIRKGIARDQRHAFAAFLGKGAAAYVPRVRLTAEQCIARIRESGGVAVLAHPGEMRLGDDALEVEISRLRDKGLWGLECWSPRNDAGSTFKYLCIAGKFGLFPTAGSDFHGANRPGVDLGVVVESDLLPWARLGISL